MPNKKKLTKNKTQSVRKANQNKTCNLLKKIPNKTVLILVKNLRLSNITYQLLPNNPIKTNRLLFLKRKFKFHKESKSHKFQKNRNPKVKVKASKVYPHRVLPRV